jgi:hypothetical protein
MSVRNEQQGLVYLEHTSAYSIVESIWSRLEISQYTDQHDFYKLVVRTAYPPGAPDVTPVF